MKPLVQPTACALRPTNPSPPRGRLAAVVRGPDANLDLPATRDDERAAVATVRGETSEAVNRTELLHKTVSKPNWHYRVDERTYL